MPQQFADLSLILKEFAVTTVEELFQKRTNGRQVRAIDVSEPPKLVSITSDKCKELCDKAGLQYEPGYYKRVIARTTTTEKPDRYGDIIRASGVNIDNYRRNPVVLFAHEHSQPPVGNSIKIWQDVNQKAWKSFDLYFDDKVDPSGRSDLVFRMVSSGAMPGGSIGFIPKQCKNDHTKKEREAFGLGDYGVEYLSCDYLEHSACSVPANPECLLNTLKAIELGKFFAKPDLDKMEQLKLFNVELIDVFANSLGVKRTVSLPAVPPPEKEETIVELSTFEDHTYVMRPYPNEHACRLAEPEEFSKFRRGTRKHEGKEYSIIYGQKKGEETWAEQAYRYNKDTWTADDAKAHCKSHDGKTFDPATDGKQVGDECKECGEKATQKIPPAGEKPMEHIIKIEGLDTVVELLKQLVKQELSDESSPEGKPSGEQEEEESKGLKLHKLIDMTPKIF